LGLSVLAGMSWLCAVLLALEAALAAPLTPTSWVQHHAALMWVIFGVLAVIGFLAVVLSQQRGDAEQQRPAAHSTVSDELPQAGAGGIEANKISQRADGDRTVQIAHISDSQIKIGDGAPQPRREPRGTTG
jgi:hypothetical protein